MSTNDSQQDESTQKGPGQIFVRELLRIVEPVSAAIDDGPHGVVTLLDNCGIGKLLFDEEIDKIVRTFEDNLVEPIQTVVTTVEDGVPEDPFEAIDDVDALVSAVVDVFDGIQKLSDLEFQAENLDEAGDNLVDYLLIRYLNVYYPDAHATLAMTGIIEGSPPNRPGEIDLSGLGDVFQDPNKAVRETMGWGATEPEEMFQPHVFLYHLSELLRANGVEPIFIDTPRDEMKALTEGNVTPTQEQANHQSLPAFEGRKADLSTSMLIPNAPMETMQLALLNPPGASIGVRVVPVPSYSNRLPGIALLPYASASLNESGSLGEGDDAWKYELSFRAEASEWGLGLQPTEDGTTDPQFVTLEGSGTSVKGTAEVTPPIKGSDDEPGRILLGEPDASRLELNSLAARAAVTYEGDDGFELNAELPASGLIKIKPKGGFLEKVLPDDITSDFEVAVGWSNVDGLYFDAGATLEVTLPQHATIGPIELKELHLSVGIDPESGAIVTEASAGATVTLGPITATVERMGVDADLSFPENRDGNFGPVDMELGFKPPDGVGLSIEAGPVTGSGYLFFDPDNERYAGAAQLKVSDITITAVGLITTELPDGSDGFSFLVMVAGEFPPINIGPGFTLNGVGGLLGINRKFRKKPLRKAVRKGNLNSILFPDPELVKNNPQRIISDLRTIFPPAKDSYLFGPIVKLGFGTPPVMLASLGVVLEIPSYRVAILGRFEVVLPSHEAEKPSGTSDDVPYPPIVLNLDVAGVIDIPGKTLSIDASLYDSRVVNWTVEGDMALRSSWGEKSRFILSVGGFNPRYQPPKDAPGLKKLDRVKVSLDIPGGQPVVEFTGYFAVTSNTFQVGAQVYAEADFGQLRVFGKLGFDALFQFKPFKFIFDFLAQFEIEAPAFSAGFKLDGTIKGPTPFNINGSVELTIGPISVSTQFDVTLGSETHAEELPAAEVLPELRDALGHSKNWDAQLPGDGESLVSLRGTSTDEARERSENGTEASDQDVLAHPKGTLTVRQTVVPLGEKIEKFGENTPKTYDTFRIESMAVAGDAENDRQAVDGEFAPAKYEKLSNSEKLDKPDFVEKTAGTTVGDRETLVGGENEAANNATRASFVYEERFTDESHGVEGESVADHDEAEANATHTQHTAESLVSDRASVSDHDGGRFSVTPEHDSGGDEGGLFSVDEPDYTVVDENTFEPVEVGTDGLSNQVYGRKPRPMAEDLTSEVATGLTKDQGKRLVKEAARADGVDASDLRVVAEHQVQRANTIQGGRQ